MRIVVLVDGSQRLERAHEASRWARRGGRPLSEQAVLDLQHGRRGCIGIEVWNDDDLSGYGHLAPPRRVPGTGVEIATAPGVHRGELMDTVLTAARDLGLPRPVRIWTESPDEEVAARDWGMAPDRHLHRVARPLPLGRTGAFPDGFSVRPFVLTAMEQWLEANNRAFSDHPDNGAWTAGDVEERIQLPWFEAAGFLTVWHGSRLVGTNWTKVHAGGVGEIYVIFVDPDYQGRGLGRATAAAGLEHLTASGCRRASLYVEGTNVRALSLYDALGFRTESTAVAFSEG